MMAVNIAAMEGLVVFVMTQVVLVPHMGCWNNIPSWVFHVFANFNMKSKKLQNLIS